MAYIDFMALNGWNSTGLIYSQTPENIVLAERFRAASTGTITIQDELILDLFSTNVKNAGQLKHRLQSTTKHSKARIILIMVDSVTAMNILHAADESVMGGAGYSWLLSQEAIYQYGRTAKNSNADKTYSRLFGGVMQTGGIGFIQSSIYLKADSPMLDIDTSLKYSVYAYMKKKSSSGSVLRDYIIGGPSVPNTKESPHFGSDGVRIRTYGLHNV